MANQEAEATLYQETAEILKAHEALLSDRTRNGLFYRALKKHVRRDSIVVDIGSGTGLWAIAAARMGAKKVVAIEQNPLLLGLIKTLARANGVADRIEVLAGDSQRVELGKEFDIVISETIGHLIFDEQITSIMLDARERFLKPGGVLIPAAVTLRAAAAHLRGRPQKLPLGIPVEYDYFESLMIHSPVALENKSRLQLLSAPRDLIRLDLQSTQTFPDLDNLTVRWAQQDTARIHGFAVWADALLAPGIDLTTARTTSWATILYRVKPFQVERGDLEFALTLTTATHYWTATLTRDQHQEVQSYSPAHAASVLLASARTDIDLLSHHQRVGLMAGR
jgi:precorrin-6B methylase 2